MEFSDTSILRRMFGDDGMVKIKDVEIADSCNCECAQPQGAFPNSTPVGMAYVPFQAWEEPFDENTALMKGTIFPSLDKPFLARRV